MFASRIVRACVAAIVASLSTVACDRRDRSLFEHREALTVGSANLALQLRVPQSHARQIDRYVSITRDALRVLGDWFGPYPHAELTINDRGLGDEAIELSGATGLTISTHWLAPTYGGSLEASIFNAVATRLWARDDDGEEKWLADGIAAYAAARALDERFPTAHSHERRLFGGVIPAVWRSVPIQGPRAQVGRYPYSQRVARAALALFTLERHLGWSTLQQALFSFADRRRTTATGAEAFFAILNEVSGRDLKWFVDDAFNSSKIYDYGLARFSSEGADGKSFVTSIVAQRVGDAPFRPVDILVTFAEGNLVREQWDGREPSVQFEYESASRATTATIDPDSVLWLDANPANNQVTLMRDDRAAAVWSARWATWLQDALLSYAMFF